MENSISIKETEDGYLPRLVIRIPHHTHVIPAGKVCKSWKEAWIVAKFFRSQRQYMSQVRQ